MSLQKTPLPWIIVAPYAENSLSIFIYIFFNEVNNVMILTSLIRRLQARTLPDATPPIGTMHHFNKTANFAYFSLFMVFCNLSNA